MIPPPSTYSSQASFDNGPRIGFVNYGINSASYASEWLDEYKSRHFTPEQDLMWAIIEDAIYCAGLPIDMSGTAAAQRKNRETLKAREWLQDRHNSDWLFSFTNCCWSLNLDPDYLMKGIKLG